MAKLKETGLTSPKPYHRPVSATWWLKYPAYRMFMLRELSSVFVAAYAVILLVLLHKLSQSQEAYDAFYAGLKSWPAIAFHFVALGFAVLHTITWFNATPQAVAIRRGEKRVSPTVLVGINYLGWVLISLLVLRLVTAGI